MYNQRKEDKSHRIAAFGGEAGACVGVEKGYNVRWDRSGNFQGMTVYNELYAQFGGGLARVSTGYEAGLFGAEGRGVYVGGTVAGIHGELTHIEKGPGGAQGSWGLQESMYLSFGNNTGIAAADGKTTSMVSAEIWFPSLGSFGHSAFGDQYDVSNDGLGQALADAVAPLLEKSTEEYQKLAYKIRKNPKKLTYDDFVKLDQFLLANGFEHVEHMNKHPDGYRKATYRKVGSIGYGNIELMYSKSEKRAYSSHNYGNNRITHFLIDYLGWKGRGY